MAQEPITIKPFFVTLDVIGNCIDLQVIFDYIRINYKKEVVVLNANDYIENSGRHSSKGDRSGKIRQDNSTNVARGLKIKIDNDYSKQVDNKRKFLQAVEKYKASLASGKLNKKQQKHAEDLIPKFDGKIDVIYIILNYPYLPKQLNALFAGGLHIDAFIGFTHPDGPIICSEEIIKTGRSDSRRANAKKSLVFGADLDYTNNPTAYPPKRWQALQPTAPVSVSFVEVPIGKNAETTFNNMVQAILRIDDAKEEFSKFVEGRIFQNIRVSQHENDFTPFNDFLEENPTSFVDAIFYQLRTGHWKSIPPPQPPTALDQYKQTFKNNIEDTDRRVIIFPPKDPPDLIFKPRVTPAVYEYLYPLLQWEINKEKSYECAEWSNALDNLQIFYAYAGQKFDTIFARANKEHKFGLPSSFFDWQQWSYSVEHSNICDVLADAVQEAGYIDTIFDDTVGVLYIMTMRPIPRTIGSFVPQIYMPLTMQSAKDWMDDMHYAPEVEIIKSRTPITPSTIARKEQDIYQLLPSLQHRFEQRDEIVYRLPINQTNSEEFVTPYFFESKMYVQIIRNCMAGNMNFYFKAFINNNFTLFSSENSISIRPAENIVFMITFPFSMTIFFNQQSMCFNNNRLTLQSQKETPIVITSNGDILFEKTPTIPLIVKRDGTIGQMLKKNVWTYVDKNGEAYDYEDGQVTKKNLHSAKVIDPSTREIKVIRPDDVEYAITSKGERRILFRNEISIFQNPDSIEYDIPNFPMIKWEENILKADIDKFLVEFRPNDESLVVKIQCDEFMVEANKDFILIKHGYNANSSSISPNQSESTSELNEIYINSNTVEFKNGKNILYASSNGVERKGELLEDEPPKKKKIDLIEGYFGKIAPIKEVLTEAQHCELHKIFPPKFFAIRSNLTGAQFFRKDILNLDGFKSYTRAVQHPNNSKVEVVSFHKEETPPYIFIKNKPLNKLERINLLKTVHVQKPSRKKQNDDSSLLEQAYYEALEKHDNLLNDATSFDVLLSKALVRAQEQYIDEITPLPPPPEEILIIPPPTPNPRLLNMQHNLYDKNDDNYWKSNESEFGYPLDEPHKSPKIISPRTQLCDPPRFFSPKSQIYHEIKVQNDSFVTQKMSSIIYPEQKTIARPKSATLSRNIIRFGEIHVGEKKVAQIMIKNTGIKPLRYNFSQIPTKNLRILTVPGMITPGLSLAVKIELDAVFAEEISTFFEIRTPLFSTKIQVTATVLPRIELPKKQEEEEEEGFEN